MSQHQHIIETNGEAFRVKTKVGGRWVVEWEWSHPRSIRVVKQDVLLPTFKDAVKWIHQQYGLRASIAPRQWRSA